ncbi:MAG: DUF1622 domain-containing protein [Acidimicrobiia bacterium]
MPIVLGTTYEAVVEDVVRVVEAIGALIMILGGLYAGVLYTRHCIRSNTDGFMELRRNLGRAILLGLEVLIIADIIRTIVVEPTLESVGVLGIIVIIRILLSFSLEVEVDGSWPWNHWKTEGRDKLP